jgi:hypothetical protein
MASQDLKPTEYMKTASQKGLQVINYNDRQEVADFFTGAKQTSEAIDETIRASTYIRRKGGKVVHQTQDQIIKRRDAKAEEKRERKDKKVIDHLLEGEKKIAGKTNCL